MNVKPKKIISCIYFFLFHSKSDLYSQLPDIKSSCRFIKYAIQNNVRELYSCLGFWWRLTPFSNLKTRTLRNFAKHCVRFAADKMVLVYFFLREFRSSASVIFPLINTLSTTRQWKNGRVTPPYQKCLCLSSDKTIKYDHLVHFSSDVISILPGCTMLTSRRLIPYVCSLTEFDCGVRRMQEPSCCSTHLITPYVYSPLSSLTPSSTLIRPPQTEKPNYFL
jgi:hypothetical protein